MWEHTGDSRQGPAHPHHKGHKHYHGKALGHPHVMQCHCPGTGLSRFLQPCLLMLLAKGNSHGYELIEKLPEVGYMDATPDPATVYKVLRRLEADGVVESDWDTSGSGPAKRVYSVTREGEDMLSAWAASLRKNKESVEKFLKVFRKKYGK